MSKRRQDSQSADARDLATARREVCDEIIEIMAEYDRQEKGRGVDTPGGLEHMGDVWGLLGRWRMMLEVK